MATDEPQIAAKPPQAAMVATPRPPRRWPRKVLEARNNSRLMPEAEAKAPIKRNSGMTANSASVAVRIGDCERIFNAGVMSPIR